MEENHESSFECPMAEVIDPDKLVKAWSLLVAAQRDQIVANETSNRRTRWWMFAAIVAVTLMTMATTAFEYSYLVESRERDRLRDEQLQQLADNIESTSKAVRATSEAVGAKVEADSDEPRTRRVAIEAQREAIEAEMKVASDPVVKAEAAAKLVEVESKAAEIEDDQAAGHLEETRRALREASAALEDHQEEM